jgi:oxygen-independent coproporphyrinogen-3 oxidase
MLYDEKMAFEYLDALFLEIDLYKIDSVKTLYIGGGTPTALPPSLLEKLLKKVRPFLDQDGEFTVEINVENATDEKLAILKNNGINRLSIGVESTSDRILRLLNRRHTFKQAQELVRKAKAMGFVSINVDLIYGLPTQTKKHLIDDLNNLLALDPEHLSVYSLTVHPGTVFYLNGIKEQDEDQSRDHYDLILKTLRKAGYRRYEVSNFAKPGHESRHNLTYWRNEEYYGVGLGAAGYVDNVRYENTRSLTAYLKHTFRLNEEKVDTREKEKYFWILNLRLEEGFLISDYYREFGEKALERHMRTIEEAICDGLMIKTNDRIRLTDGGLMLLDRLLVKLI